MKDENHSLGGTGWHYWPTQRKLWLLVEIQQEDNIFGAKVALMNITEQPKGEDLSELIKTKIGPILKEVGVEMEKATIKPITLQEYIEAGYDD